MDSRRGRGGTVTLSPRGEEGDNTTGLSYANRTRGLLCSYGSCTRRSRPPPLLVVGHPPPVKWTNEDGRVDDE